MYFRGLLWILHNTESVKSLRLVFHFIGYAKKKTLLPNVFKNIFIPYGNCSKIHRSAFEIICHSPPDEFWNLIPHSVTHSYSIRSGWIIPYNSLPILYLFTWASLVLFCWEFFCWQLWFTPLSKWFLSTKSHLTSLFLCSFPNSSDIVRHDVYLLKIL